MQKIPPKYKKLLDVAPLDFSSIDRKYIKQLNVTFSDGHVEEMAVDDFIELIESEDGEIIEDIHLDLNYKILDEVLDGTIDTLNESLPV